MGLTSIQADIQNVLDLLTAMSTSDATPDSLGDDISQALEMLTKALADTEKTSADVIGKDEGLNRLCAVVRLLKEELARRWSLS
jgi:hypothetical protein